jgi:hypothetical protein
VEFSSKSNYIDLGALFVPWSFLTFPEEQLHRSGCSVCSVVLPPCSILAQCKSVLFLRLIRTVQVGHLDVSRLLTRHVVVSLCFVCDCLQAVMDFLGEGNFGLVHLLRSPKTGRLVVNKMVCLVSHIR